MTDTRMEETVAELLGLGARILLAIIPGMGKPDCLWTEVRFPHRKWTGENKASVEYADTSAHPKALFDILQLVKSDIASGALT